MKMWNEIWSRYDRTKEPWRMLIAIAIGFFGVILPITSGIIFWEIFGILIAISIVATRARKKREINGH